MIRRSILGISLAKRVDRRRFVIGFWMVEAILLSLLLRFPEAEAAKTLHGIAALGCVWAAINLLPIALGGFSIGGVVKFYEGRPFELSAAARAKLSADPEKARRIAQFVQAVQPVDEREAQLRDWAFRQTHRVLCWAAFSSVIAFAVVTGTNARLTPHAGLLLLELLFVALLSLPQSILLWTLPEEDVPVEAAPAGYGGGQ